jgi:DNA/RNA-binding domain of Phe-tRNA-synthetase-like protein
VTTLTVAGEVVAAFDQLYILSLTVEGLDNVVAWPEVEAALRALEASGWSLDEDDQRIASWHDAYRRFGTNPRRQRPSVDALARRLTRTGRLPRINPLVDCYNLVSVTHVVPAGAFDLDRVDGHIVVRFARPGDVFIPLGDPGTTEEPHQGEVVYADSGGVLTRHWNHRDSDRTKVTATSRRVLVVLEAVDAAYHAAVDAAAADLAVLVGAHAIAVVRATVPLGSIA